MEREIICEVCGKKKKVQRSTAKVCGSGCRAIKSMKNKLTMYEKKSKR